MISYWIYHYSNGVLCWVITSVQSFNTKDEAIKAARWDARKMMPESGEYKETEDGAEIWFTTSLRDRIHLILKVR